MNPGGLMDIGSTPQQQLVVIQYVHKRANIIGLVIGGLGALVMVPVFFRLGSPGIALAGIGYGLTLVVGAVCYMRAFVWAYYWLASKLGVKTLAMIAVAVNPVYEAQYHELHYTGNGNFRQVTRTETKFSIPAFIIASIGLAFCFWIGLYFAIKYTILCLRLKNKLKTVGISISRRTQYS